jgi:hypothetical protein
VSGVGDDVSTIADKIVESRTIPDEPYGNTAMVVGLDCELGKAKKVSLELGSAGGTLE